MNVKWVYQAFLLVSGAHCSYSLWEETPVSCRMWNSASGSGLRLRWSLVLYILCDFDCTLRPLQLHCLQEEVAALLCLRLSSDWGFVMLAGSLRPLSAVLLSHVIALR